MRRKFNKEKDGLLTMQMCTIVFIGMIILVYCQPKESVDYYRMHGTLFISSAIWILGSITITKINNSIILSLKKLVRSEDEEFISVRGKESILRRMKNLPKRISISLKRLIKTDEESLTYDEKTSVFMAVNFVLALIALLIVDVAFLDNGGVRIGAVVGIALVRIIVVLVRHS